MPNWKDSLRDANSARTIERARSCTGKGVEYKLGHGGMNPERPMGRTCDCSGFVAWSIGIPRELPPASRRWLDTDAYWAGGGPARNAAGFPLFTEIPLSAAQPGDLLVYPDTPLPGGRRRQGHMGIITKANGALKVVHCSRGNWRNHEDAIRETDDAVFARDPRTRAMRIDYASVRRYLGVPETAPPIVVPVTNEDDEPAPQMPRPSPRALKHSLLADNPTLQRVLAGELVLEPARMIASGVGAVQQGLNVLARDDAEFRVELGPNDRNLGVFGPRTQKSLKYLQKQAALPRTGMIDAETLKALDRMLMEHGEGQDTEEDVVEGGRVNENTVTEPEDTDEATPIEFKLYNDNNRWSASADGGPRFYVGTRVRYAGLRGLMNSSDAATVVYRPAPNAERYGHWAYLIYPSVMAESEGRFQMLNTYDRARFTFGFFQLAAHVFNGDFVRFFRALLADETERRRYFPDLELEPTNGRIMRRTSGGLLPLETPPPNANDALMRYLNPSSMEVEEHEVLQAARFIHWALNSARHQEIQVRTSIETAKRHLRGAQNHIKLDGRSDKVCLAVMDILHQGRAKYSKMKPLVENNNDNTAYDKLLKIGIEDYASRLATVRRHVAQLEESGHLGRKRYSAGAGDFV